jgi:hypothetical protein
MNSIYRLALMALALGAVALAQAQQRSVRAELNRLGVLTAWKTATPITPIPDLKLERTQVYELGIKGDDGRSQKLSLMLGANAEKPFAHYAAIIYNGAASREAGVAHGSLTSLVARDCIGLDAANMGRVRGLMNTVISTLKAERVSRTMRVGPLTVEASAEFTRNRLSVVMILERNDAPGKTWGTYCGFEN